MGMDVVACCTTARVPFGSRHRRPLRGEQCSCQGLPTCGAEADEYRAVSHTPVLGIRMMSVSFYHCHRSLCTRMSAHFWSVIGPFSGNAGSHHCTCLYSCMCRFELAYTLTCVCVCAGHRLFLYVCAHE